MDSVVVGLTGQTGAGKSTVSEIMKGLSCAVINADDISRTIMSAGSEYLKKLAEKFGCDIINKDGSCNRKLLAKRAFASKENTELLNSVTHPPILERTKQMISQYKKDGNDIIIFDAPQLFESGGQKLCDYIISVTAPLDVRLQRIMKRDSIDEGAALMRIGAQYDEVFYTSRSDFVVDGSVSVDMVKIQAKQIILYIRENKGGV